jgi:hypothetical protein
MMLQLIAENCEGDSQQEQQGSKNGGGDHSRLGLVLLVDSCEPDEQANQ